MLLVALTVQFISMQYDFEMRTVGKQGVSIKDELINGIFDELTLIWYEKQLMSCEGLAVGDDHE